MEKEKKLEQVHCVAWMQTAIPWASANRRSTFPGHSFQTATIPAKMPHRSYCVFSCKKSSSRTVRTTIFISTSRASEEISFARQTGLVCEVLQAASVRYCRSPPTPDAAPANKPAHGGARRHAGPCQHWSQPTNSVGRRQKIIKIIISQRRETTSSTPTLYHSCLGSYFSSSSLPTVRINFAHPQEEISSGNPTASLSEEIGRHRVRHLADPDQLLIA